VSDPAQLLGEFRQAVDQHLRDLHGLRPSDADKQTPTNDDHHLIAFAAAASLMHPDLDPCAQLRTEVQTLQAQYNALKHQVDEYGHEDYDPKGPKPGQTPEEKPPPELVEKKNKAGAALNKKKAELAACEKAAAATAQPGQITYELHQVGAKLSYWLCVPHPTASAYLWYEFARKGDGSFAGVANPRLHSTPYPFWIDRPVLTKTGDWTGHDSYGVEQNLQPGTDPPHWSPVLVMGTHKEEVQMPGDAKGGHSSGNKKIVDAPDPPDAAVAKNLHDLMSSKATISKGVAMIDKARPLNKNLCQRVASNSWPPITLRGRVKDSDLSGEDFSGDHSTAYIEDGGPSTGWQATDSTQFLPFGDAGLMLATAVFVTEYVTNAAGNVHDRSWPGMDWDMHVATDPDVAYLSSVCRPHELQVEIEQFALPKAFRPHAGDWLQTSGRWVFDCGHGEGDEHYAEIHPPELVVATHMVGESTHTSATTTGAWLGSPLKFVVFPPPRPSVTSKLQVSVKVDARQGAGIAWQPSPDDNPNHVVFTITAEKKAPVLFTNTGMVVMSRARFLRARIQCGWAEQTAFVNVDPHAAGVRVFFRDPDAPPKSWSLLPPTGVQLRPVQYLFRGAGSGWNYAPTPLTLEPGSNHFAFNPTKEAYPSNVPPPPDFRPRKRTASTDFDEHQNLLEAAWDTLSSALVVWQLPAAALSAVPRLSGAYKDAAFFVVHLLGYVDGNGKPFADLESAVIAPHKTSSGAEWYPPNFDDAGTFGTIAAFLKGKRGPGVAKAKVQAALVLGNDTAGRHFVAQVESRTSASGAATFIVRAGSHPEDVALRLHVAENPVNTWFKPTILSPSVFFGPGTGSDLDPNPTPYSLAVPSVQELTAAGLDLRAISAAVTAKALKPRPPILVIR